MKRKLEKVCNDFSNAYQLLRVLARCSVEMGAWLDVNTLKNYHQEMAYALEFVADSLKAKSNALWSLIEDLPEDDEDCENSSGGGVNEEELILALYRELDENGRMQTKGFMEGFKYRSMNVYSVVKGQGGADTP